MASSPTKTQAGLSKPATQLSPRAALTVLCLRSKANQSIFTLSPITLNVLWTKKDDQPSGQSSDIAYASFRLVHLHLKLIVSALSLGKCCSDILISCEDDTHTAMTCYFRLTKYADLNTWLLKNLVKVAELIFLCIAFNHDSLRS